MGRIDEGVENAYRRAIALRPSYAAAHCNLGKAMQDLDRPDEAIAAFNQAIALKPDMVEAWNNLGTTLALCGCVDEPLEFFRRAVHFSPVSTGPQAISSTPCISIPATTHPRSGRNMRIGPHGSPRHWPDSYRCTPTTARPAGA